MDGRADGRRDGYMHTWIGYMDAWMHGCRDA